MKSSDKDRRLDQLISRAAAGDKNKPIPNFDKWLKDHPNAVQRLRMQAQHLRSDRLPCRKSVHHEPLLARFPQLAWAGGIAALFLMTVSCTVSFVLARENRILRQDLQLARREIVQLDRQQRIEKSQDSQRQAISELHVRVKKLEKHVQHGISRRTVWCSESPYYAPERPGEL